MKQQRNTATKQKIKKVFAQLLHEQGFNSITVSAIAQNAGINRGTFYLHYTDKYDLFKQMENGIISDLTQLLLYEEKEEHKTEIFPLIPYKAIYASMVYIKENFLFFKVLTVDCGDLKFIDRFKKILEKLIEIKIRNNRMLKFSHKGFPSEYADEILLSSAIAIILLWVRKGALEKPEQIAQMIIKAQEIAPHELLM